MAITLNETFRVSAPPERVWEFLKDPAQVVTCLPGAELTETIDEKTYGGRVKVKVGPITAAYAGRATLATVDDADRRMQIIAEGKESGGSGQARMTMTGKVNALAEGGSEVSVDAHIDIAGRVMQFGRGLIESVNKQLFKQFADSVQDKLSSAAPEIPVESTAVAPASDVRVASADLPVVPANVATGELSPPPTPLPTSSARGGASTTSVHVESAGRPQGAAGGSIAKGKELRIIPLLWSVLVGFVKGLFGGKR